MTEEADGGGATECCQDLSGATDSTNEDVTDAAAFGTREGRGGKLT